METKENQNNQTENDDRRESCMTSRYAEDNILPDDKKQLEEDLSKFNIDDKEKEKSFDDPLVVTNPIIKDGMKSYVIYSLIYKNQKDTPIYRRYSDFYALRAKLTERWPGVFIPNIPPKKAVGNLEKKIIEMRVKLLNSFSRKLARFPAIFESDEMRVFLTNTNDLTKALNSLPIQSFEDIYLKYKSAFPDFYETYEIGPAKTKITEFSNFMKKALANLKNFKEIVFQSMDKKQQEIENYNCLISVFSEYEKYTLMEYSDNDDNKLIFFNPKNTDLFMKIMKLKEGYHNPYTVMYDWLCEEEIDFEAISEAIGSLEGLYLNREKLVQHISQLEATINNLKAGKKSFKSFFNFKSVSEELNLAETEKLNADKTLRDLEGVIKLATFNMDNYIEYFKVEKLAAYYKNLKAFADMQRSNSSKIDDVWQTVALDKNIRRLMNNEENEDTQ